MATPKFPSVVSSVGEHQESKGKKIIVTLIALTSFLGYCMHSRSNNLQIKAVSRIANVAVPYHVSLHLIAGF